MATSCTLLPYLYISTGDKLQSGLREGLRTWHVFFFYVVHLSAKSGISLYMSRGEGRELAEDF